MRAGWEGNARLKDYVRRVDSGAALIAETVAVAGSELIDAIGDWQDGTGSGFDFLNSGGIRLTASESTLVSLGPDDDTATPGLTTAAPFDALIIQHLGTERESVEMHTLTARLDPRADGGQPKTVDHFIAELYRVTKHSAEGTRTDEITVSLIARSDPVDATGEVEADFTFTLQPVSGRYPVSGPGPERDDGGVSRPETMLRIIALQADGSVADNVTWLSDSASSGSETDSSTYQVTHYQIIAAAYEGEASEGGSVFEIGSIVSNMPEFALTKSSYSAATRSFLNSNGDAIADITGTGDLVIVAMGEEWADSSLTFEIWDGSGWVECVDGDVIGVDNQETIEGTTYGNDLSGVSTTGPWDVRVTLTPSTDNQRSPVATDFGIQRVVTTSLAGAATVDTSGRRVDPVTLKANLPKAQIRIPKTGEKDFRDYGSELLVANHIGDIEVRVWVGDPNDGKAGQYLHRSEWMLHSVWEVEDYATTDNEHIIEVVSPLRRLRVPIPPFVVTSGNDGTRDATTISGTRKAAWEEIVDTMVALAGRFRGPGVEDTTNTVAKTIRESDGKDELDRIAFLGGETNIESQGRLKAVKVMRDEPIDYLVERFPIGSYEPRGPFGPGFRYRTDEYFVRYNYEETDERFENERRYLNATALDKLGGAGLSTTQRLDEETAKWINTQALADAVGDRVPKHFGNGQIVWPIRSHVPCPHIELGDVVTIATDLFVARSPINSQPIRGVISAPAIVIGVDDPWGRDLDLWVPGFEYIALGTGTVTFEVGRQPWVQATDELYSIGVSGGEQGWKRRLVLICGPGTQSVNVKINDYVETLGIDDAGYPSQNVTGWNYDLNVTPSTTVHHVVQDSSGSSDAVQTVRYDEGNLLAGGRTFSITLTPYSKSGGAGVAGKAITVTTRDFDDYDFVGFRTVETLDRRVDNNDTPGLGGFDLDMDATANGFAFEWTNNTGAAVDISQVRFNLKATGTPGGPGDVTGNIYADSSGLPGASLSVSAAVSPGSIGASYQAVTFDFATPETVANGTTVHVGVAYASGDASDYISVEAEDAGSCSELNGSWAAGPANREPLWRLYIEDDVERFARRAIPTGNLSASINTSTGELEVSA